MKEIPVFVVLLERALLLDAAGPLEVLRVANREQKELRFVPRYIGPQTSVVSSIGLTLSGIEPLPKSLPDGAIVVLTGKVELMMPGSAPVSRHEERATTSVVTWLRSAIRPEHKVVTICSGALLAGGAGLLDGYSCTTHHDVCAELATVAPAARVLENRLFVEDRERYSSAGVTAGVDLMLHIVAQLTNPTLAVAIARSMVVYLRRSGSDPQLSPWLEARNHIHPAVHRVQDAITSDPTRDWTLPALARLAGSSSRHLTRLFQEYAGMSITDYKNRLRIALARELLTQTSLDMEQVAERSGFGSTRQLRRTWNQWNDSAPSEARHC